MEYGKPSIEAHPIHNATIGSKMKYSFVIKGKVIMPKPVRNKQNIYVFLEPNFLAKGTRSKAESMVTIL